MATLNGDLISQGSAGAAGLQIEEFLIALPIPSTFSLGAIPARDATNDPILRVTLNGVNATRGQDYSISANVITWISSITLEAGDRVEMFYQPA